MFARANHPLVLDDIVSSLDRDHRGFVIDVLRQELADRQIILLTHDREWYAELRSRLIGTGQWDFYLLGQYIDPTIGIRVFPSRDDFNVARGFLPDDTNAAGNKVRAIMDEQLAFHSEKLELSLPFLQGAKNDHRTGVEFIEKLVSEGRRRFKVQTDTGYSRYQEAIDTWQEAIELLVNWANRASHGGSLSLTEANRLINVCSASLDFFMCTNPDCSTPVSRARSYGKRLRSHKGTGGIHISSTSRLTLSSPYS